MWCCHVWKLSHDHKSYYYPMCLSVSLAPNSFSFSLSVSSCFNSWIQYTIGLGGLSSMLTGFSVQCKPDECFHACIMAILVYKISYMFYMTIKLEFPLIQVHIQYRSHATYHLLACYTWVTRDWVLPLTRYLEVDRSRVLVNSKHLRMCIITCAVNYAYM